MIGISTIMAGLEVEMAVPAHVIKEFVGKVFGKDSVAGGGDLELV